MSTSLRRTDGHLDSHAARAALVDYIATLRRDSPSTREIDTPDVADALEQVADDLSAILRRWDIATPEGGSA